MRPAAHYDRESGNSLSLGNITHQRNWTVDTILERVGGTAESLLQSLFLPGYGDGYGDGGHGHHSLSNPARIAFCNPARGCLLRREPSPKCNFDLRAILHFSSAPSNNKLVRSLSLSLSGVGEFFVMRWCTWQCANEFLYIEDVAM